MEALNATKRIGKVRLLVGLAKLHEILQYFCVGPTCT